MSEVVIDHAPTSYSVSQHNTREERQSSSDESRSDRVRHAGSDDDAVYSERWSQFMTPRVPSRPPGELRAVDE